jgi:GT2 family glycosyltransferase
MLRNKFDVIILSLVVDEPTFNTTKQCVDSYLEQGQDLINQIYVVETNPKFDQTYNNKRVEVIKPNEPFNYNKFFNIALSKCKSEFVMGPNNDLVIQPNCIQTILTEFQQNQNIHSISPIDRQWHRHSKMYLPSEHKLYYGYEVSLHVFGCIFASRRSVFNTIGFLDESFYFFYQDNDYSMCLLRNGLLHGVHTGARVKHASGHSNNYADQRLKYTNSNMQEQGQIYHKKWSYAEPFKSGGFSRYKDYNL